MVSEVGRRSSCGTETKSFMQSIRRVGPNNFSFKTTLPNVMVTLDSLKQSGMIDRSKNRL